MRGLCVRTSLPQSFRNRHCFELRLSEYLLDKLIVPTLPIVIKLVRVVILVSCKRPFSSALKIEGSLCIQQSTEHYVAVLFGGVGLSLAD